MLDSVQQIIKCMWLFIYTYRNKAKLGSGPPDHTPQQCNDATPPAPSVTKVAKAGSESSEGEGAATANSGRRRKGKAKNKRKPTKVSY